MGAEEREVLGENPQVRVNKKATIEMCRPLRNESPNEKPQLVKTKSECPRKALKKYKKQNTMTNKVSCSSDNPKKKGEDKPRPCT